MCSNARADRVDSLVLIVRKRTMGRFNGRTIKCLITRGEGSIGENKANGAWYDFSQTRRDIPNGHASQMIATSFIILQWLSLKMRELGNLKYARYVLGSECSKKNRELIARCRYNYHG